MPDAHMFWRLFETTHSEGVSNRPLILWIQVEIEHSHLGPAVKVKTVCSVLVRKIVTIVNGFGCYPRGYKCVPPLLFFCLWNITRTRNKKSHQMTVLHLHWFCQMYESSFCVTGNHANRQNIRTIAAWNSTPEVGQISCGPYLIVRL